MNPRVDHTGIRTIEQAFFTNGFPGERKPWRCPRGLFMV